MSSGAKDNGQQLGLRKGGLAIVLKLFTRPVVWGPVFYQGCTSSTFIIPSFNYPKIKNPPALFRPEEGKKNPYNSWRLISM